jgi:hypothetical protein
MDDDLGVAAGMEDVAEGFELGHELLEVVDLAVEDHGHRAVLVEQGCWPVDRSMIDRRRCRATPGSK